jgi:stress response protein YsnF
LIEKPKQPSSNVIEEHVVPIVEERLTADKKVSDGRTVTVRTSPITEDTTIHETVSSELVDIKRVPFDKVVTEMPSVRVEGDVTIIPVVEERLVISKELVLIEEIHMHKFSSTQEVARTIPLTRLEVTIDDDDKK